MNSEHRESSRSKFFSELIFSSLNNCKPSDREHWKRIIKQNFHQSEILIPVTNTLIIEQQVPVSDYLDHLLCFPLLPFPTSFPPILPFSQQTPDEFKREYKTRVESTGQEYTANAYHAYDAVWSVAIALHNYTFQQLLASGSGGQTCSGTQRLEDFATTDNFREQRCIWEAIQNNLELVEFTGVSVCGLVGLLGSIGLVGLLGSIGPVGLLGSIGPVGLLGSIGPMGLFGSIGPVGLFGSIGPVGLLGSIGPVGLLGSIGPVGLLGSIGPWACLGLLVGGPAWVYWSMGLFGSIGPVGLLGSIGPVGLLGSIGLVGLLGSIGPVGLLGSIGPVGLPGSISPVGLLGSIGPVGLLESIGPLACLGLLLDIQSTRQADCGVQRLNMSM